MCYILLLPYTAPELYPKVGVIKAATHAQAASKWAGPSQILSMWSSLKGKNYHNKLIMIALSHIIDELYFSMHLSIDKQ